MSRKRLEEGSVECPECGGKCKPAAVTMAGSKFRGWRCGCGYELISPGEVEKAYLLMQARKQTEVKIAKRGNSYMITIPRAIAVAIGIDRTMLARVHLEDDNTISIRV